VSKIEKLPSVVIHVTVKNAEDTIKKCIDSLLELDYPNKQIYVTEAYSTDRTYEILKHFGRRIKLERVKGNAPKAHNHIFKKITSEFIALTDADCIVEKNWVKNLIKSFDSPNVVAAGGFCKTPKDVNNLQRLIGMELENRFHKMPKYVSRLPTMNLCVRTKIAKIVKMDDSLDVTFEADWGNKLTRFGKMVYVPNAVIYHYHRSTLIGFFKQQLNYGKYMIKKPSVYIKSGKFGDYISKPIMGLQLILFNLLVLFSTVSLFLPSVAIISNILFVILIILYLMDIVDFTRSLSDVLNYLVLFFIRTFAWTAGLSFGILDLIRGK